MTRRILAERRQIGAYYTPQRLADVVSTWAIRSPADLVLEPSFGGCSLLEGAQRRLSALGSPSPNTQLHGCDVDPQAFRFLFEKLGLAQLNGHFLLGDFLALAPSDLKNPNLDAIIGNPPYLRHHSIRPEQAHWTQRVGERFAPTLSRRSNLWAYFLLHATLFLRLNGRMAWLLPPGIRHADYAKPILDYLRRRFDRVRLVSIAERIFQSEGANEATVALLAEGWHSTAGPLSRITHDTALDTFALDSLINSSSTPSLGPSLEAFKAVEKRSRPISQWCSFLIGVVTGDSKFFLFDSRKQALAGIPAKDLRLIATRATQLSGLTLTRANLNSAFFAGAPTKILHPRLPFSPAVDRYLATMPKERIAATLTFRKRQEWFQPLDRRSPDAFFVSMSHSFPRMVLNSAAVPCTNSLYEVSFKPGVSKLRQRLLLLSLTTTFGQLSAEITGRHYGAGLLKHEPSDAAAIRALMPRELSSERVLQTFRAVDRALKAGAQTMATALADNLFIRSGLFSENEAAEMRLALAHIRRRRQAAPHRTLK